MYDFISFQHGKSKQRVSYQLHITRNTSWIVWGYIKVFVPLQRYIYILERPVSFHNTYTVELR